MANPLDEVLPLPGNVGTDGDLLALGRRGLLLLLLKLLLLVLLAFSGSGGDLLMVKLRKREGG